MQKAPTSLRLHIGIFGRRNVGKSSVVNNIAKHSVSIVSPHAGTTTDPVRKAMELQPLGPVLLIDTAGIDDMGDLGELRIKGNQESHRIHRSCGPRYRVRHMGRIRRRAFIRIQEKKYPRHTCNQ